MTTEEMQKEINSIVDEYKDRFARADIKLIEICHSMWNFSLQPLFSLKSEPYIAYVEPFYLKSLEVITKDFIKGFIKHIENTLKKTTTII